ncbi:hypothetical protein Taro_046992 [Colocasia esculenta]|uniref:FAD synthase n=1 Tax=Colocasia esculenta TaxID=4460 RepID=A0A843X674_COLES|nr:hypothetical protein [Colocasia esculenta]
MAPSLSRSFGAASAAALHLPRAHSPFSRAAAATMTAAAFSSFRPSAGPPSLSRTCSCGVPLVLGWKSAALGTGFRCAASATAVEAPGNDHQVSHLLDSAVQSLCTTKEVFLQDIVRIYCCLKEKSYMITHNSLKGYHLSTDMSRSCEQQGLEVDNAEQVKDSLLTDCGPDQECVTGGIVALGKFDALHIGHRELAVQASKAGTPFLLSFAGMADILGWENRAPIVAKCDRRRVLTSWAPFCGDITPLEYHVEFSKVRHLSPREFVERLSKELGIIGVVAGENYRFGYRAEGDASDLVRLCNEYGMEAYILSPVLDSKNNSQGQSEWVSSTRVRQALAVGDMRYVSELLGRKHRLVLTANEECIVERNKISIPKSCMLNQQPKDGFYEGCSLLMDDKLVGPCRVVIDTNKVHAELDSTIEGASPNWNCQHVSIEFA